MSKLTAFWRGWVSLSQDFSGKGSSLRNFFVFYKTRHILLSDSANCTVLRAVVLTQYQRVPDRPMDRIGIASTASIAARCKKSERMPAKVKYIISTVVTVQV